MKACVQLTISLAVCLAFAGLTTDARGVPLGDGAVLWAFSGTVISVPDSLNTSGCCNLAYRVGQTVTGSLTLAGAPPTANAIVRLDVPGQEQELFSEANPSRQDGSGGSPDTLTVFNILSHGGLGILQLNPGWSVFEADGTLSLVAPSGNAWNGINPGTGDVFPNTPPDPALFTTREIDLNLFAINSGVQVGGEVRIMINAFPEPGASVLALAGSIGLAAARRTRGFRRPFPSGA
jgi:hypothetical protein